MRRRSNAAGTFTSGRPDRDGRRDRTETEMRYGDLIQIEPIDTVVQLRAPDRESQTVSSCPPTPWVRETAERLVDVVIPQISVECSGTTPRCRCGTTKPRTCNARRTTVHIHGNRHFDPHARRW